MEQPLPEGFFQKLPEDIFKELSVNSDYETTLKFCANDTRFKKICDTDKFWEQKIKTQYPNEQRPDEPDPRNAFILLESQALLKEAERLNTKYETIPEYQKLLWRETEIYAQIENLKDTLTEIRMDQEKLVDTYASKAEKLSERAARLQNVVEIKKQADRKYRYWNLHLKLDDKIKNEIGSLLYYGKIDEVQYYFREEFNLIVKSDDLVGISDINNTKKDLPNYLIYFYTTDGKLDFDWTRVHEDDYFSKKELPHALLKEIRKKGWSIQDFEDKYDIPFNIVKI